MNRAVRFQILAFIGVRVVFNTMHRMVYPFLSIFGRGLGVDLATLALALTLRSAAGTIGPFLATISDRRGRKSGMLLGLVLFVAGAGLAAIWQTFYAFSAALVLSFIGYQVFIPSMQAYLGDQVNYARRGLAIALTETGWSLSFILGIPLVGLLIDHWGWVAPFFLLTALGLVSLVVFLQILPGEAASHGSQVDWWHHFGLLLSSPAAVLGIVMGFFISAANESVNLVFGVWMENTFAFKMAALGAVAIGIGLAEFSGEALVGWLADRWGKGRSVMIGLLSNCLAAVLLSRLGGTLTGAVAGLLLFYLTFEFALVSSLPLMTELLPRARATLMAANLAMLSLGRALGAGLAPHLYAWSGSGIQVNLLAAILLNLFGMLTLTWVLRLRPEFLKEPRPYTGS